MEYFIILSQLILLIIFVFTLKCEISKHCSDSFVFVSVRTFIMCVSAISFFLLFEKAYHNITFLSVVFVPILSGILYIILEVMSPSKAKCKKGDCGVFTTESVTSKNQTLNFE